MALLNVQALPPGLMEVNKNLEYQKVAQNYKTDPPKATVKKNNTWLYIGIAVIAIIIIKKMFL